jgi:methanogenic corrinoid protein MtbC1
MQAVVALRDAYLRAVLDGDRSAARALLEHALRTGARARDLYIDVLQGALYEVGERWARAEISVAQEHLATATTQSLLAWLAEHLEQPPGPRRGRAVVACAEGELHALGGRIVADFLEASGWEVRYLGALTPPEQIAALAATDGGRADVVALSAALPERLPQLERACTAVHALDPPPLVLVGGRAFAGDPERARLVGADAYAADSEQAVAVLERLCG